MAHIRRSWVLGWLCAVSVMVLASACVRTEAVALREPEPGVDESSRRGLPKFASSRELHEYLRPLMPRRGGGGGSGSGSGSGTVYDFEDGGVFYDFADESVGGELLSPSNRSITNTQEASVDEGGIVKMIGDHLVVLRRGRLFSVDLSGRRARAVDAIDISPRREHEAWYDEILVSGNMALVIGYSYDVMASELLRFELDAAGKWHRRDAWLLRSDDYYSSRNYASRLVDGHLVMYTQIPLRDQRSGVFLPRVARWTGGRPRRVDWTEVMAATDIHRPVQPTLNPMLHLVLDCDVRAEPLSCTAQGIVGPWSRTFYVSGDAVYVWIHDEAAGRDAESPAALYRLPLDGSGVGALRTAGAPVDQFSFKDHGGRLAVLLRASGSGDGMFGPERASEGALALLRVPVSSMTAGLADAEPRAFTPLPAAGAGNHALVNRFVGDHLLYGHGDPWGWAQDHTPATLHVVRYVDPQLRAWSLPLAHGIERIEPLGAHALVVGGARQDLHFSSIELDRDPRLAAQHVEPGAAQGETRSHGFFFSPSGERRGILGLPVRAGEEPGWAQLVAGSSGVLYLGVEQLSLTPLGALVGTPQAPREDHCLASCTDWYGSARPLFIDDRVFALIGYELVEARVGGGRIEEISRTNLLTAL